MSCNNSRCVGEITFHRGLASGSFVRIQLSRWAELSVSMARQKYKDFIDHMVAVCHHGQGAIGPNRARLGVWNTNATADTDYLEDQFKINQLLASLSVQQREVVARMLAEEFQNGVFETLKALEDFGIEPFIDGYEGSAYHDFIGRAATDPWQWPKDGNRTDDTV